MAAPQGPYPPPPPPNYPPPGYLQQFPPGYGPAYVPEQGYMVPGLAPVYAAPKKSDAGLIAVVVVVILVIMIVVSAVLYVLVAGLGPGQQAVPPTAVLQGGGSWASSASRTTYTFTISTVTPTGAIINPADLQYIVSNPQSTVLYSGGANQNTSVGGFAINVLFNDALDAGRASAGDRIQITVTPVANNPLMGGRLQVNFNGASLAMGTM